MEVLFFSLNKSRRSSSDHVSQMFWRTIWCVNKVITQIWAAAQLYVASTIQFKIPVLQNRLARDPSFRQPLPSFLNKALSLAPKRGLVAPPGSVHCYNVDSSLKSTQRGLLDHIQDQIPSFEYPLQGSDNLWPRFFHGTGWSTHVAFLHPLFSKLFLLYLHCHCRSDEEPVFVYSSRSDRQKSRLHPVSVLWTTPQILQNIIGCQSSEL